MDTNNNDKKISLTSSEGIFSQFFHLIFPKKDKKSKKEIIRQEKRKNATRYNPLYQQGLSTDQVNSRIQDGLVNVVPSKYTKSIGRIICKNVFTYFNILMIGIAVILLIAKAPISNIFFLGIVTLNILIGTIQEIRTKMTVDKLKLITDPKCKVIRNSSLIEIKQNEVVLDDILVINSGDQLSSDSILIEGEVEVNESSLTGESLPIKKKKGDMLLSGSFVISGKCYSKVEQIGEDTFAGNLSSKAKSYQKTSSMLQASVNAFISIVSIALIPLAGLMIYTNYLSNVKDGLIGFEMFQNITLKTSSSVIGMIPSGLVLLVSAALCVGVINLANIKTSVQDLYSIEKIARVTTLCLDKTGTLTDGTMVLDNFKSLIDKNELTKIISSYLSCFDTNNSTSKALIDEFGTNQEFKCIKKMEFSSNRKYSACSLSNNKTYALGAYEFIFKNKEIDSLLKEYIKDNMEQARRVIVLAEIEDFNDEQIINPIKVIALFSIEDHIRKEAYDTIKWFKDNNVKVRIISGDNPITVSNIACKCGVDNAPNYISLDDKTVEQVYQIADKYTVFGRVKPEQKEAIVKALKQKGEVVAMTGDGVNDIPAMKASDCSVVMNNGSDATKGVAHLILLDSNFKSMPQAVKEGRRVINNIQLSSSLFLMKTTFVFLLNLVTIVIGLIVNKKSNGISFDYPFTPSMMLILECLIIGIPSFCLALQPNNSLVKGNFMSNVFKQAIPSGLSMFVGVIIIMIVKIINPSYLLDNSCPEVLAMTFIGLITLITMCYPYNLYRGILVSVFTLLIIGCICLLPEKTIGINIYTQMNSNSWIILIISFVSGVVFYAISRILINLYCKKKNIKNN